MKKIAFLMTLILVLSINTFSQTNIVDLQPSSPIYPQVVRMVESGIMFLDNQGRFRGSQQVLRYDLAEFGSNILDFVEGNYGSKIEELSKKITALENMNIQTRLYNLESTIFAHEDRLSYMDSTLINLNKNVSDILNVLDPSQPVNEDNVLIQNIVQEAVEVARKASEKEIQRIADTSMASLTIYETKLKEFVSEVDQLNEKYENTIESLNYVLVDVTQSNQEELRNFVDKKIEVELDALKTALHNIAKNEVALFGDTISSTFTTLDKRISDLEGQVNPYMNNYIKLENKVEENEAKINYLIRNFSTDPTVSTITDYQMLDIKTEIEGLKLRTNNLSTDLKIITDQINSNRSAIETFDAKHFYYNSKINEMQNNYNYLSEQIIMQNKKIDNLLFEVSKISPTQTPKADTQELTEIRNLQERVSSLERTIGIYYDQIGQLNIYAVSYEEMKNDLDEIKRIIEKNEGDIQTLKNNNETLQAQLKSLSNLANLDQESILQLGDITKLSENVNILNDSYDTLKKNNLQIQNDLVQVENRLIKVENTLNNFEVTSSEIKELKDSYNSLLQQYYEIKSETDYLTDPISMKNDIETELSRKLATDIVALEKEIANINKKISSIESRASNLEKSFVVYDETLVKVSQKTDENIKRLDKLESSVQTIEQPSQSFIPSIITGLIGVAVGAGVVYLLLSN